MEVISTQTVLSPFPCPADSAVHVDRAEIPCPFLCHSTRVQCA